MVLSLLMTAPDASAQELQQRVSWESFEGEEPAWLLGARASFGWDVDREEPYPALGLTFGYIGVNHLYLGGSVDARLTDPHYLRLGLRLGVLFTRADFAWGFGVSPGFLVVPARTEAGLSVTWGAMARLRLTHRHYLSAHAEADLLFEQLGFRETRNFFTAGLGWAIVF